MRQCRRVVAAAATTLVGRLTVGRAEAALVLIVFFLTPVLARAGLAWNLAGGGSWDTSSANWTNDAGVVTNFMDDGTVDVIFNKTAGGAITISSNMSPHSTTVSAASGTYTFSGGPIDSGAVTKSGAGTLSLQGSPNTCAGAVSFLGGTIALKSAGSQHLGTGPLTIAGGTTFEITGNNAATLSNSAYNVDGDFSMTESGGRRVDFSGGNVTLGATAKVNVALRTWELDFYVNGDIGDGGHGYGITKDGARRLLLTGTNSTFTGKTIVTNGILYAKKLANAGVASSLGAPTGANATIDIYPGGALQGGITYTTDRTINLAGAGPGTVSLMFSGNNTTGTFNSVTATGTGPRTLALAVGFENTGGDRAAMTFNAPISDSSDGGAVGLAVSFRPQSSGGGKLELKGVNTFSGPISISTTITTVPNTMLISNAGQLGSGMYTNTIAIGAGCTLNYASSAPQTLSGAISGSGALTLSGSGTLTLDAPNTYGGATTVSGGTLKLGASGSISSSTNIAIAAGATFDVAAQAAYVLSSLATISASGGASAATLKAASGGTVSLGSQPVSLTYDGAHPALTISQGTLALNGNAFTIVVPGPALGAGVYTLVSSPGGITGTVAPTPAYTGGNGAGGRYGVVAIDGNRVILTVEAAGSVDAAHSTISPRASLLSANGSDTQAVTVQARDAADRNLTSGGATVLISLSGAGSISATTDNGDGTYTATVTAPASPASGTVTATLNGTAVGTAVAATNCVIDYVPVTLLTWNTGSGDWDVASANWTNESGVATNFTDNGAVDVVFNKAAGGTITISSNMSPKSMTVSAASGTYTFSGGPLDAGSLTKTGAGQLTVMGTNTYSGGTVINGGTLVLRGDVGATLGVGTVTLNGATFSLERVNATNALTLNGGSINAGNGFGDNWNGPVTVNSNTTVNAQYNMGFGGTVSGAGGFTKTGANTLALTGSNTFSGALSVNAGTLSAASLNRVSGGTPGSNLGAPATAVNGAIALGATTSAGNLLYTGAGETTDRSIKLAGTTGGATVTQGGTGVGVPTTRGESGVLKFTSEVLAPGTPGADNRKTLTLTSASSLNAGTIPGRGEISGNIGDSLAGNAGQLATGVTKAGTGTWTLSGTNTYTGATRVQGGTLVCVGTAALGGGALDITNGAILRLDFVGTRQVAGLTVDGIAKPSGTYGSSGSVAGNKDDAHFAGLGTVTVGAIASPTTNTLALTGGADPSQGGDLLTFTATVTGGQTPAGRVIFYDGLIEIGTGGLNGSFQAQLSLSSLTGGVHQITALYTGNRANSPSASASLSQTVLDSRPATTTTLSRTAGTNPSSEGTPVSFEAAVTGVSPTGSVAFYDGSGLLGTAALNGASTAGISVSNLRVGWRSVTARYLGDSSNAPSVSTPPLVQTVKSQRGNGKVKVFILAGQSNMVGKGRVESGRNPDDLYGASIPGGLGSLRHMLNADPGRYGYLADTNNPTPSTVPGWRTMTNVWVTYWGESNGENRRGILDADFGDYGGQGRIGPEYGFGLTVGSQLGDQVLLIKTAWGGKSLKVDFRPPSSGGTVGPYYTQMVGRVHQVLDNLGSYFPAYAGGGCEIVGFGWHQGWNDIGEATTEYETNLVNLIKDIRVEFAAPALPVVIANTGMANGAGGNVLVAQMNVGNPSLHPEFAGTVTTVDTRPFDYGTLRGVSTEGYHWNWNAESYFNIGESMGLAMMVLLPQPPLTGAVMVFR